MARRRRYNPNQRRNAAGKWTSGSSLSGQNLSQKNRKARSSRASRMNQRAAYAAKAKKGAARKRYLKATATAIALAGVAAGAGYVGYKSGGGRQQSGQPVQARTVTPQNGRRDGSIGSSPVVTTTVATRPVSGPVSAPTKVDLIRKVPKAPKPASVTPKPVASVAAPKAPASAPKIVQPKAKPAAATAKSKPAPAPVQKVTKSVAATKPPKAAKPEGAVAKARSTPVAKPEAAPVPKIVRRTTGAYGNANVEMSRLMVERGITPGIGEGRMNNDGKMVRGAAKKTAGTKARTTKGSPKAGAPNAASKGRLDPGERTDKDEANRANFAQAAAKRLAEMQASSGADSADAALDYLLDLHSKGKTTPAQNRRLRKEGLI